MAKGCKLDLAQLLPLWGVELTLEVHEPGRRNNEQLDDGVAARTINK